MVISSQDLQYIEQQLGRKPRGVLEISVRSKDGLPLVIKTQPIIDNEVFPTLYYLVSRELIDQVSTLESESLLAKLQQKIDTDEHFRENFLQAQSAYQNERNQLALANINRRQKEALETGIGGVKDLTRVKCLHCHLAHYLATGNNPVGEQTFKNVAEIFTCPQTRW